MAFLFLCQISLGDAQPLALHAGMGLLTVKGVSGARAEAVVLLSTHQTMDADNSLFQTGEGLEALGPGGEGRRVAGWECSIREASGLIEEQVLVGEPQVNDCHGRNRIDPGRIALLEVLQPIWRPATNVHGAAATRDDAAAAAAAVRRRKFRRQQWWTRFWRVNKCWMVLPLLFF